MKNKMKTYLLASCTVNDTSQWLLSRTTQAALSYIGFCRPGLELQIPVFQGDIVDSVSRMTLTYPNLSRRGMACLLTIQKSKQPWGRTLLRSSQEADGFSQPVNSNLLNHILLHLRITGTVCLTQREGVARLGSNA